MKAKKGRRGKYQKRVPAPASPALVLPAAWGIEAELQDGFLQLKQSDAEGHVDSIMLSRNELAAVIDKFGAWAAE